MAEVRVVGIADGFRSLIEGRARLHGRRWL